MTSANNNIKALIANQNLPRIDRSAEATVTRLSKATPSEALPPAATAPASLVFPEALSPGIVTQSSFPERQSMTDLLIRIRDLAAQALKDIRSEHVSHGSGNTRMAKLDTAISAIDQYCEELVTRMERLDTASKPEALQAYPTAGTAIQDAHYAQTTSARARAEIEQHAGKALLAQANQRPAFVMALLH